VTSDNALPIADQEIVYRDLPSRLYLIMLIRRSASAELASSIAKIGVRPRHLGRALPADWDQQQILEASRRFNDGKRCCSRNAAAIAGADNLNDHSIAGLRNRVLTLCQRRVRTNPAAIMHASC